MNKTINYFVLLWQFYLRATRTTAFLSKESWSRRFQKSAVCQHTFKTMQLCQNAIFSITGADRQNFNSVMTKNLIHNNKVIIIPFFFFFFFSQCYPLSRATSQLERLSTRWLNSLKDTTQVRI